MRSVGVKIAGSFGIALILLMLIGILSYVNIRKLNANTQWVIHTHLVIENLESLLARLVDAENAQRGYIITGDSSYLAPYHAAIAQIDQHMQVLRRLTHDNPRQQQRLDQITPLIQRRLVFFAQGINRRQSSGGFRAAQAFIAAGYGQSVTNDIRALVAAMEGEEQRLLEQRNREAQSSSRATLFTIVVGIPIAFVLLGLLAFAITRSIAVPLARLSGATEQIAAGKLAVDIPVEAGRRDEIGTLQQNFQKMQQRVLERTAALEESNEALRQSEERFRLMIESVKDYAIILLDPEGRITSWNAGAERIKGYRAEEILGKPFEVFYTPEAIAAGRPQAELRQALAEGRFEEEGWRVRKDGSRFWANVIITPLYTEEGALLGFVKVTRDISERRRAEEQLQALNADLLQRTAALEASNKELEDFSYSVAHDLRSPLRSLDGFSRYLLEHTIAHLNAQEQDYLQRMRAAAQRMARLIDDLLNLARIGRTAMRMEPVNMSDLAAEILARLHRRDPQRRVVTEIAPDLLVQGDHSLLRIALEHLLDNAWKFTSTREEARITLGMLRLDDTAVYFVRDNGVGFDMAYSDKLFTPFQRLHAEEEFPGTGIGLALAQRIIQRHGGRIWAEAEVGHGATFYFTLGA